MRHLLVTNDFPPKLGGIQSYLWELWRRLPPEDATVLTTPYRGDAAFDEASPITIHRTRDRVLLPGPSLAARIRRAAAEAAADLVVLDPALPLGMVGPSLRLPYAVVLHGAEVAVPGRLPGGRAALAHVLRQADRLIAAGGYPAAEALHAAGEADMPAVTVIPPGVDTVRFHPLTEDQRSKARAALGVPVEGRLIVAVSRLVPRKGMDVLIDAVARLRTSRPDLTLAIAGGGRDRQRLERRAAKASGAVRFLGRVPDGSLPRLYGSADVFAMPCRNRWGGLEQEGFGIVYLEAAACGVPSVAGDSGGAAEAVADGLTGTVVHNPRSAGAVAAALAPLLDDADLRAAQGAAARQRAVDEFDYDRLAARLRDALA
ncbi:MAG: phosphatidyl-myo-inositol dimannoside synthase [Acidimicrobiaceae bacterium]|nr:phosphatidyl-myo-inositol dimannoside synthase [Acidimicrobiaceae bacterium]